MPAIPDITKPGYTFEGWYPNEDYVGNQKETYISPLSKGDQTYYANWVDGTFVDSVDVSVTAPVADEKPTFTASTDSTMCTIANGEISWLMNGSSVLSEYDVFKAGNTYRAVVWLSPNEGCEITEDTEVFINENKATFSFKSGNAAQFYYEFAMTEPALSTQYNITVANGIASVGDGTVITKAESGTVVTITANAADEGSVFDKWMVNSGSVTLSNPASETTTFTMPAGDVQITATYMDKNAVIDEVSITIKDKSERTTIADFTPTSYTPDDKITLDNSTITVFEGLLNEDTGQKATEYEKNKNYCASYRFDAKDGFIFASNIKDSISVIGGDVKEIYRWAKFIAVVVDFPADTPMPTEYTVTVDNDGNGTGTASPVKAVAGTEITLSATADSGYHFKEWQVVSGSVTISDNKFTMPDSDVKVKAIFEVDTPIPPAHVHNLVYKDAKEATCTEAGYKGHYQCTDCSIIFEDKLGKIELKPSEIVIPAAGHVWNSAYSYDADSHWTSCTVCGEVSEKTAHTFYGSTCLICGYQKNTSSGSDSSYNSNSSSDSDSGSSYTSSTRTRKAVTGTWIQDEKGWWYKFSNGTYPRNGWAKLQWQGIEYWYYFDADGYMKMGWLESSGSYYYLNPIIGTNSGKMLTGWQLIDQKWYYFSTEQGAKEGSLLRNTVTPDHYQVDQDGVWKQ